MRVNKDGVYRFSSYNDINRALVELRCIDTDLRKITNENLRDDVSRNLALREYVQKKLDAASNLILSLFDAEVLSTFPVSVDVIEVRKESGILHKKLVNLSKHLNESLSRLAEIKASSSALHLPNSINKIVSSMDCRKVDVSWEFVTQGDKYLLCAIYEIKDTLVDITLKEGSGALDVMEPFKGKRFYETMNPFEGSFEEQVRLPITIVFYSPNFSRIRGKKIGKSKDFNTDDYALVYFGDKSWLRREKPLENTNFISIPKYSSYRLTKYMEQKGILLNDNVSG